LAGDQIVLCPCPVRTQPKPSRLISGAVFGLWLCRHCPGQQTAHWGLWRCVAGLPL